VWRLRRHVDGELGCGPVEVGDRAAAFQWRRMRAGVVQLQLGDDVRPGQRHDRCRPCRRPPSQR
jgi:hypothetical protein